MPGELGAAAISGGSDLLGGLLGLYSQHQANKTNIMLTRETNELNAKLARENYQLQRDLLERNLQYASPLEQRRMLEAAGYNPYDFVSGTGSKPVAATPTPQLPTMQAAHVEPENALGASIGRIGLDLATYYKTMNEAKKAKAETKGIEIDNQTRFENNLATLVNMGKTNEALTLQNAWNSMTMEDRAQGVKLDNLLKEATEKFTTEQRIDYQVRNKFAENRNRQEVANLVLLARKMFLEGTTEITKQFLNETGAKKNEAEEVLAIVRSEVEKEVGEATVNELNTRSQKNLSEGRKARAEAATIEYDLQYMKDHQLSSAYVTAQKLIYEGNLAYEKGLTEQEIRRTIQPQVDKLNAEVFKLQKEGKWKEAEIVSGIVSKLVNSLVKSASVGSDSAPMIIP